MKILVATPAYGGLVTTQYALGLLDALGVIGRLGHQGEIVLLAGESLIPRGRNACATRALVGGFDKLLFIDADMVFNGAQIEMLLKSDKKIIGGTYPLKNFPITLNFNALDEQNADFGESRQEDNYQLWMKKYADPVTGEVAVKHIPTGFMLVDCEVLRTLSEHVKRYRLFLPDKKQFEDGFEFFPIGVSSEGYESEDWAFCRLAREHGYKIYLNSRVITGHVGSMQYMLTKPLSF